MKNKMHDRIIRRKIPAGVKMDRSAWRALLISRLDLQKEWARLIYLENTRTKPDYFGGDIDAE